MARFPSINPEIALKIKEDIWNGMGHNEIREKYGISYQISVDIKGGRRYDYIPWPDGSTGAMPKYLSSQIGNAKRAGHITQKTQSAYLSDASDDKPLWELFGVPKEKWDELDAKLRKEGSSMEIMIAKANANLMREHDRRRAEEHQRLMDTYDERHAKHEEHLRRLETDPVYAEEWERSQPPAKFNLPKDQVDPEANQKMDWDEIVMLAKLKIVQVASEDKEGTELALKPAIQIVLKLFPERQWGEDHVLRMIYVVKKYIENFWDANPLRDPRREYQMLEDAIQGNKHG